MNRIQNPPGEEIESQADLDCLDEVRFHALKSCLSGITVFAARITNPCMKWMV
jgi:hypothetical protein